MFFVGEQEGEQEWGVRIALEAVPGWCEGGPVRDPPLTLFTDHRSLKPSGVETAY